LQINQDTQNDDRKIQRDAQAIVLHDFVAIQPNQLTVKKVISISVFKN